jgi:hypothetical protein
MVAEAGSHTLEDGTIYKAGRTEVANEWKKVIFPTDDLEELMDDPIVFSQIVTDNTEQPMVTRHKNVDLDGFQVRLQAETSESVKGAETINWLAIDIQNHCYHVVGDTGDLVDNKATQINF